MANDGAPPVTQELSLEALVEAVSEQLLDAQRHRLEAGRPAVFEIAELTLEVSFVVTSSRRAGGGFDLKVVKADADVHYDRQSVQKVTLRLDAVRDQPQPFGGFGALRPRRTASDDHSS